jgi:hypothetical protein
MAKPAEIKIARRAYELWQQAGEPEGEDQEFCDQAERQLEGQEQLKDKPRI